MKFRTWPKAAAHDTLWTKFYRNYILCTQHASSDETANANSEACPQRTYVLSLCHVAVLCFMFVYHTEFLCKLSTFCEIAPRWRRQTKLSILHNAHFFPALCPRERWAKTKETDAFLWQCTWTWGNALSGKNFMIRNLLLEARQSVG